MDPFSIAALVLDAVRAGLDAYSASQQVAQVLNPTDFYSGCMRGEADPIPWCKLLKGARFHVVDFPRAAAPSGSDGQRDEATNAIMMPAAKVKDLLRIREATEIRSDGNGNNTSYQVIIVSHASTLHPFHVKKNCSKASTR